jgi:type I restriction enzyme R subunit
VVGSVKELLAGRKVDNHAKVYASLDPALTRFEQGDEKEQNQFRDLLGRYISMYGFVSQIVSYTDQTLERDYIYARALEARLPRKGGERIDIGAEIKLTHLRTEQELANVAISLSTGEGDVEAFFPGGGAQREPDKENLSAIVKLINERFGTQFSLADQVLFDQFEAEWEADPEIIELARNNQFENFLLIAPKKLEASVLARASANDEILSRIFEDKAFKEIFLRTSAQMVFERLNKAA